MASNFSQFGSHTISRDLIKGIIISVFLVSVLILSATYWFIDRNFDRQFERKLAEYTDSIEEILEWPLWTYDLRFLEDFGVTLSNTEFVEKLVIKDSLDAVLISIFTGESAHLHERQIPIHHEGERIGTVEIGLTDRPYSEYKRDILFSCIFMVLVVILSLILVIQLLVKRSLIRPIQDLIGQIDLLAEGKESGDLAFDAYPQREFRTIIASFNRMSVRIRQRETDLKRLNMAMAMEIEDRRRMAAALRESTDKYQQLFEMESDAIFLIENRTGKILEVNSAACELYGYSREAFLQMDHTQVSHEPENTRQATAEARSNVPLRYHRKKDGAVFPVEISSRFFTWKGEAVHIAAIRDISFRIEAEKERKRLESQFFRAQKMESLGTLAGGIAHDFNNLLMGIQGRTSLMMAAMEPAHPFRNQVEQIESYVESASALTRQLLGLARQGKVEVLPADVNLLIQKSVSMFGRTRKGVDIHLNLESDIRTVEIDNGQIEQVLLNLFVNAGHAMEDRGDLFIETRNLTLDPDEVHPYSAPPGDYVRISVTDTGIGMDEPTLQKVFDPFFTTKGIGRGTGLGLASAYGIIKNHEGIITVYSEPGCGSTFNIFLPASEKAVASKPVISELVETGTEHILLIDDEEMILEVGRQMLEHLGYTVSTAESGEAALAFFHDQEARFDLIILDMILPDMNGREIFHHIMASEPEARVLLASGFSMNGQAKALMEQGCKGFIQKPFNLKVLSQKIRQALGAPSRAAVN